MVKSKSPRVYCFVFLLLIAVQHGLYAKIEVIEEVNLPGVYFGITIEQFKKQYPDADLMRLNIDPDESQLPSNGNEQYLLKLSDERNGIVDFRSGSLAIVACSYISLGQDEQVEKTKALISEFNKRYGHPKLAYASKMVKSGVVNVTSLIYTIEGDVSVILQSTEIELAMFQVDFSKIDYDRVLFPYEKLVGENVSPAVGGNDFKDYVKSNLETSSDEKLRASLHELESTQFQTKIYPRSAAKYWLIGAVSILVLIWIWYIWRMYKTASRKG